MNVSKQFPSPIGELHFSIFGLHTPLASTIAVSVPYRGATFLNCIRCIKKRGEIVSVPYRGATFLNDTYTKILEETTLKVSVPYRGATFLNKNIVPLAWQVVASFRPLSGSYISQFYEKIMERKITSVVSVPYRGATFLNCYSQSRVDGRGYDSFRPLSGSYISQSFCC